MIVKNVFMDMEFDKTVYEMMTNFVVNTSATKEHVSEIERTICTVKNRNQCIVTTIAFKYFHKLLITNIVHFSVLWLNAFIVKNEKSEKLSPRAIMVRTN